MPTEPRVDLPATFGKYELLERIATGGMAEVYLARRFGVAGFEKRLVIKRIRRELAQDPHHISLFINEAKIGVHLNHQNIVQLYDLGRVGSDWYIAMEHLAGKDLNKLVKALRAEGRRVPHELAVYIVAEICRGLAYAHSLQDIDGNKLGLVHRDVSPHNVLLTYSGGVKLVDFGIARLVGTGSPGPAKPPEPSTTSGNTSSIGRRHGGGKYAYMSPEQANGGDVDHRTDVFSTGIVLWELLVGHRLFQHADPAEKLRRVRECRVPTLVDEGIDAFPKLQEILDRALAANPDDRYEGAAIFEEDLRAWLYDKGQGNQARQIADLMSETFPRESQSRGRAAGLQRMLADVAKMGGQSATAATPGQTPSQASIPERLRPARGERKRVVALVIDVDGLTELSLHLDPEKLFRRRFHMLRWMKRTIEPYGGLLQRIVDDQVLVLFGVPRTRSDDLERALECALELVRTVDQVQKGGLHLNLAIGVHVGDVTVRIGRRHARYVAKGDTTRLARRLSALADHGEILVSPPLYDAIKDQFQFRGGPEVANRGGRPPSASFSLESRRHGLRIAGHGPWLRRGKEIDTVLGALQDLSENKGSVITLIGDVGSGKSRLAREVRDLALRRGVPVYLARAGLSRTEEPSSLFKDVALSVLGLAPDTPRSRVADELDRLRQLGLGQRDQQAIQALLGVSTGAPPSEEEIQRAACRMLTSLAREQESILILEDLHLLATDDLQTILDAIQFVHECPMLCVLTYTGVAPDAHGLGTLVELGNFDQDGQRRLIRELLQVSDVGPELVKLSIRTSEGNPLYVEEMIKYLLAQGRISIESGYAELVGKDQDMGIPDSLAGLIAARIDALEPTSKGAMQLAATIGLAFQSHLIGRAMGLDDPTPIISDLASHGLISRADSGVDTWKFGSDLVREVALRSILGVQRRTYHRLISEALESAHEEDLSSVAETLAYHCAKAARHLDAARYFNMAGQRLEDGQFLEAARTMYERGLRQVRMVPETPDTGDARMQGEAMLALRSGSISELLGETRRAERSLQLALDISGDAGLPWIEVRTHLALSKINDAKGNADLAEAHCSQARSLARLEADPELQTQALEVAAGLAYGKGHNDAAEDLWNEALQLAGDNSSTSARCHIGMASRRIREGEFTSASALLEKALAAARASGDRILVGRVLNNMGLMHYWSGRYDEALSAFRSALSVREGIGYSLGVVINHHNIGDVHYSRGDLPRAWVAFSRSHELAEKMGWKRGILLNNIYLGAITAARDGIDEGLPMIVEARDTALALGDVENAANAGYLAAKTLFEDGQASSAFEFLDDASALASEYSLFTIKKSLDELRQSQSS